MDVLFFMSIWPFLKKAQNLLFSFGLAALSFGLIIPKESLDKAREIRAVAESTLFKGSDLYLLDSIDVGEYAYGPETKRELIKRHLKR